MSALRNDLVARVVEQVPDAAVNGDPDCSPDHRLPGNAHLTFPGCEGDSLLMLLDARHRLLDRLGLLRRRAAAPPRAAGDGARRRAGAVVLRFSLGHTSTQADVDALVEAIGPVVERARAAAPSPASAARPGKPRADPVRVLAAMSGGVDSAVAAARAAEAGHDVTGIHLALAQPEVLPHRGARLLHDRGLERRASRRRRDRDPFYVWDLSDRFHEDVVEDFMAEYTAGRTPNPCLRCNEKIKFAAVLERGLALGFDAVATGHYASRRPGRTALSSRTGPRTWARTSPTCSASSPRSSCGTRCSRSAARRRRRCEPRPSGGPVGGAEARQS